MQAGSERRRTQHQRKRTARGEGGGGGAQKITKEKIRVRCNLLVSLTICRNGGGRRTSSAGPLLVIAQKQRAALA